MTAAHINAPIIPSRATSLPVSHSQPFAVSDKRESGSLLVQHNTQERGVYLKTSVVFDETKLSELVHEEIDP